MGVGRTAGLWFRGLKESMRNWVKLAAIAAILSPVMAPAASWWNNEWKYRKEIGFDTTPAGADIAGTPIDVPVLVRLSLANFSYFNDTKPDGSDFRLVAGDDKTPLKFHFEKYDPQNQMALLWVRVPQITGGSKSDKIYAYYGNPDAPPAARTYRAPTMRRKPWCCRSPRARACRWIRPPTRTIPRPPPAILAPAGLIGGEAKFCRQGKHHRPATPSLRLAAQSGVHGFRVAARSTKRSKRSYSRSPIRASCWSWPWTDRRLVARAAMGAAPGYGDSSGAT